MTVRVFACATLLSSVVFGCGRKGQTSLGDKRAYTCGEVPSKDVHEETDLGSGRRLVRDGVRAEVRGVGNDTAVAVTSLDGGPAALEGNDALGAIMVIGLGALDRPTTASALAELSRRAPVVVAIAGPQDDVDVVRAAIGDAGARVVDGGVVRALIVSGMELVALPGSDDASSLADHGRGCVLRDADVRALFAKLGRATAGRPRVVVTYVAPMREPKTPSQPDAMVDVVAFLVGGPFDGDAAQELSVAPGAPSPVIGVPRLRAARTTSAPARISPGGLLLRVVAGASGPTLTVGRSSTSAP